MSGHSVHDGGATYPTYPTHPDDGGHYVHQDDGSWAVGKYEGPGTGFDNGQYHGPGPLDQYSGGYHNNQDHGSHDVSGYAVDPSAAHVTTYDHVATTHDTTDYSHMVMVHPLV
ncbi:hypothetical protein BC828DRAFT_407914 [Blastocladiella britannica]|nr:hypothetical protein BC828DRAFT_407914 [Blastocladiella britannica]